MPLLGGTGQQAYIAFLCFLVGLATSPLYEGMRPLKRGSKALEIALDLFYMLAAGGIFLLFTHTALRGILSFYTVVSFFVGAGAGIFLLRKSERLLKILFQPLIEFMKKHFVSAAPKKETAQNGDEPKSSERKNRPREKLPSDSVRSLKKIFRKVLSRNGTKTIRR